MALSKCKLGDLITIVEERNSGGLRDFYGVNINKEFMPTAANTEGVDEHRYKVIRKNRFVFSGMQTGRDECIRISMYNGDKPIVVSPAYITFEVTATDKVIPFYFFMLFLSKEKDRLGWFYSDSSIRSNLDWDRFCDITINLPPLSVQQKYVDIYNALLRNQQSYERGLDDLKLVCDGYIENLRRNMECEEIGDGLIELSEYRNDELRYGLADVKGISIHKTFIKTKAEMEGVSLRPYFLVKPNDFAYVPVTSRNGEKITLAHNNTDETFIVSSSYIVFRVKAKDRLLPEYLMLFLMRSEFDRYARFHSWGSAREVFTFEDMCEVKIPIPPIEIQQSIANIYNVYVQRKQINERLKAQIKAICPILIQGSIKES